MAMSTPATESTARTRLREYAAAFYEPEVLADSILALLEHMECVSNSRPECDKYRRRTGLLCTPEFRGQAARGRVEDEITGWLAEFYSNASAQVTDLVAGARPDIVYSFERDAFGEDILVVLEAKPVWQRWITTGEKDYAGVATDEYGRTTGNYASNNIRQVVSDRNKLLEMYTDSRDRLMLLALVFQRPGELDQQLIDAVGEGWSCRSRHILDRCNPLGQNIGVTGIVFWPSQ